MKTVVYFILLVVLLQACTSKPVAVEQPLFEVLEAKQTGLDFNNRLNPTDSFNMFKYMYFYNGAGVSAGDFNNDGLIDLFFCSNQGQNSLYLNKGKMHFDNVTAKANIPNDGGWSTGVSVVDINNDGLLDLYVCRVGQFESLHGKNQLLVCSGVDKNGVPSYTDRAAEYGVDFSGFSTQAAFFDYDNDGDLDMFLLNHSVHQNGTFGNRSLFLGTYHPLTGDKLYRNDGKRFTDVTKQCGINSSAIGYGLGVCVSDIDLDGYPDLYIGNDFHENDYLYINQKNGTFKDDLQNRIMHTSQFSMGVDVADINNDAYPEIISMDMLPSDPYILKRSLGEDEYNTFYMKIGYGYNYQYTRNNLQLNRRNGMFSEVGLYAGIAATDWSWSPLWLDFDNDGLKDLFISNGIPKRLNDIDYVNFVSNSEVQDQIRNNKIAEKEKKIIESFPQIKLPNKFFKNNGDVTFKDVATKVANDKETFSNGAIYADLDNDDDLDVVVNNIDDAVLVYQNKSNDTKPKASIDITLKGSENNINAIGAKLLLFSKQEIRTYENYPVKGFQSSMQMPVHIGLENTTVDSLLLVWPDNTFEHIAYKSGTAKLSVNYKKGLPKFDYNVLTKHYMNTTTPMVDITKQTNLLWKHEENPFNEFDREPLIPHMVSREGPALAVADINGDGFEDVFIGSSKGNKPAIFTQQANGKFTKTNQPSIDADSINENVDACFIDVNSDKTLDLVVATGGNEYYGNDEHQQPQVYTNDGKGNFIKLLHAFDNLFLTASCVVPYDFNNDGAMDLFIGARAVPWAYGEVPQSYLLQNDGKGHFKNVTEQYSKDLSKVGFVQNAIWVDINKDGKKDLVLSLEWDGVCAFISGKGSFTKQMLTDKKGWCNFTLPCDVNNDGNVDFVVGNLGLNSRLIATDKKPVTLYYNDFDGNGKKEQVLTYFLNGRELPFANKAELEKQMPLLKKNFLYAHDFAKASLKEIFTEEKLDKAEKWQANYFANAILINDGKGKFTTQALPYQAQFTSFKDAVIIDANHDNLQDILLVGNFYENNIQMGRYDADFGTLLINKGNNQFEVSTINGLQLKGQVRKIKPIVINKQQALVLVNNNDSVMVIQQQQIKK
jgi:hypothetical protein